MTATNFNTNENIYEDNNISIIHDYRDYATVVCILQ